MTSKSSFGKNAENKEGINLWAMPYMYIHMFIAQTTKSLNVTNNKLSYINFDKKY